MASPMTENSQVSEDALRMAEALLFAATAPISARTLGQFLPEAIEAEAVLTALRARYNGRGVELVEVAGGFQFRTARSGFARLWKRRGDCPERPWRPWPLSPIISP